MSTALPISRERSWLRRIWRVGAAPMLASAAIADFLTPLAPFSEYLMYVSAAIAAVLLLASCRTSSPLHAFVGRIAEADDPHEQTIVMRAAGAFFAVCLLVFGVLFLLTSRSDAQVGVLAENVVPVALLQEQIGLSNDSLSNIERILKEMNERSQDPRALLHARGVSWSTKSLSDAILAHDLETVGQFIDAGAPHTFIHSALTLPGQAVAAWRLRRR